MARINLLSGLGIKRTLIRLDLGWYWVWAGLRICLTLLPQTGYIHPDEYFQTVEVFAGNVFDAEVLVPWEFNTTKPIRSIPLTWTFIQIPMTFLKMLAEFYELYFNVNLLTPYTLLVVPRLSMCLLSFVSDYCLYRICYLYGQNYKERLILFASSYVSLVYMTRTFNNNIEVMCFNLLLLQVATCMAESEKINYQNDYLKTKRDTAPTIPDRVRIIKLMKLLPKHSFSRCLSIAAVTVAGVFNRPTFVCFALAPLFYWVQRGLGASNVTFIKDFHFRILLLAIYALPSVCLFIFLDSAYYGYITWAEILNKKIDTNNFVVTPLNFLKYNMDTDNLSKHGIHPRFLHAVVNMPLLFNVMGVLAWIVILKLIYRGTQFYWTLLPKPQSITGLMTLSFLLPIFMLSLVPHQEPRFISPILLPLVFLYAHMIKDFEEHCTSVIPFRKRYPKRYIEPLGILNIPMKCINYVSKITEHFDNRYHVYGRFLSNIKSTEQERKINKHTNKFKKYEYSEKEFEEKKTEKEEIKKTKKTQYLLILWYVLNLISLLFFGFIHQGGIYSLTKHFAKNPQSRQNTHLITSHTYSIPLHLLMLKSTKLPRWSVEGKKYKVAKDFYMYELGTESIEKVRTKIENILQVAEYRKKIKINYELYYALPASVLQSFEESVHNESSFTYNIVGSFFPHVSMEAPPMLSLHDTQSSRDSIFGLLLKHLSIRLIINSFSQCRLILLQIKIN